MRNRPDESRKDHRRRGDNVAGDATAPGGLRRDDNALGMFYHRAIMSPPLNLARVVQRAERQVAGPSSTGPLFMLHACRCHILQLVTCTVNSSLWSATPSLPNPQDNLSLRDICPPFTHQAMLCVRSLFRDHEALNHLSADNPPNPLSRTWQPDSLEGKKSMWAEPGSRSGIWGDHTSAGASGPGRTWGEPPSSDGPSDPPAGAAEKIWAFEEATQFHAKEWAQYNEKFDSPMDLIGDVDWSAGNPPTRPLRQSRLPQVSTVADERDQTPPSAMTLATISGSPKADPAVDVYDDFHMDYEELFPSKQPPTSWAPSPVQSSQLLPQALSGPMPAFSALSGVEAGYPTAAPTWQNLPSGNFEPDPMPFNPAPPFPHHLTTLTSQQPASTALAAKSPAHHSQPFALPSQQSLPGMTVLAQQQHQQQYQHQQSFVPQVQSPPHQTLQVYPNSQQYPGPAPAVPLFPMPAAAPARTGLTFTSAPATPERAKAGSASLGGGFPQGSQPNEPIPFAHANLADRGANTTADDDQYLDEVKTSQPQTTPSTFSWDDTGHIDWAAEVDPELPASQPSVALAKQTTGLTTTAGTSGVNINSLQAAGSAKLKPLLPPDHSAVRQAHSRPMLGLPREPFAKGTEPARHPLSTVESPTKRDSTPPPRQPNTHQTEPRRFQPSHRRAAETGVARGPPPEPTPTIPHTRQASQQPLIGLTGPPPPQRAAPYAAQKPSRDIPAIPPTWLASPLFYNSLPPPMQMEYKQKIEPLPIITWMWDHVKGKLVFTDVEEIALVDAMDATPWEDEGDRSLKHFGARVDLDNGGVSHPADGMKLLPDALDLPEILKAISFPFSSGPDQNKGQPPTLETQNAFADFVAILNTLSRTQFTLTPINDMDGQGGTFLNLSFCRDIECPQHAL
eukprot:gene6072-1087_t